MHDHRSSAEAGPIIPQELLTPSTVHKRKEQFFAETQFDGANLKRSVHLGWGAAIGMHPVCGVTVPFVRHFDVCCYCLLI
jgi:hypothetical protein